MFSLMFRSLQENGAKKETFEIFWKHAYSKMILWSEETNFVFFVYSGNKWENNVFGISEVENILIAEETMKRKQKV